MGQPPATARPYIPRTIGLGAAETDLLRGSFDWAGVTEYPLDDLLRLLLTT
ncbi:hypothetical protein [Kitasatospora sp. NPDC088346]|uniref:hypothetical protein n=1 Tax=Kitasatospora sp. NPDC088346 TaxID=3364073 RepID=UPI00382F4EF1